jgi:hypothetical protein
VLIALTKDLDVVHMYEMDSSGILAFNAIHKSFCFDYDVDFSSILGLMVVMLLRGGKAIELGYEGTCCTLCGTGIGVLLQQREGYLP